MNTKTVKGKNHGNKTPFGRWDIGECPPGGVTMPWLTEYWSHGFSSRFLGESKIHEPRFDGTLWAMTFDLRWQFVAVRQYMLTYPDIDNWHIFAPDDVVHRSWVVEHEKDPTFVRERLATWKSHTEWYAGELLKHAEMREYRFEHSPLWECLPLEAWNPVLQRIAAGDWSVSPEERVEGIRWACFRYGEVYPQTINGTDPDDVLVVCKRILKKARICGGLEYAAVADSYWDTGVGEGDQMGDVEARETAWLAECRKQLVSPPYRKWL